MLVRLPEIFYLPCTAWGNPASQSQRLRKKCALFSPKGKTKRIFFYARSVAGDLCLRKKEGNPYCMRQ